MFLCIRLSFGGIVLKCNIIWNSFLWKNDKTKKKYKKSKKSKQTQNPSPQKNPNKQRNKIKTNKNKQSNKHIPTQQKSWKSKNDGRKRNKKKKHQANVNICVELPSTSVRTCYICIYIFLEETTVNINIWLYWLMAFGHVF